VATEELFSRHSHHYWLPKSLESAFCLDALDLALACGYTPVIILLNREACQLPGSGKPVLDGSTAMDVGDLSWRYGDP